MKPSAMKNELNTAVHFIEFFKCLRNLVVTGPPLTASLENIKDIISTIQV